MTWYEVKEVLSVAAMVGCLVVAFVALTGTAFFPLSALVPMWLGAFGLGFLALYFQD